MFKKGDYIVCLKLSSDFIGCTTKENFITKQRENSRYLHVEKDTLKDPNSNDYLTFDKYNKLIDWRYATKEEIAEYNRLGHGFDVTTLKSEDWVPKVGDYIVITKSDVNWTTEMDSLVGKCFKITNINNDKDRVNFIGDINYIWRYSQKHFRKATPEEITNLNKPSSKFKEGNYYYGKAYNHKYIFQCQGLKNKQTFNSKQYICVSTNNFLDEKRHSIVSAGFSNEAVPWENVREATEEEKNWLESCILANKFIPKEEALKSKKLQRNYIVDRWYVNSEWERTSIARFKEYNCYFYFSEAYVTKQKSIFDHWSIFNGCELATEQEILDYLPEDHPDRLAILKSKIEITANINKLPDRYFVIPKSLEEFLTLDLSKRCKELAVRYNNFIITFEAGIENSYIYFSEDNIKYLKDYGYVELSFEQWYQMKFKENIINPYIDILNIHSNTPPKLSFNDFQIVDYSAGLVTNGFREPLIKDNIRPYKHYLDVSEDLIIEKQELLDTKVNKIKAVKIDLVDNKTSNVF